MAQDYVPLTSDRARELGFVWREPNIREFQTTIQGQDLPDSINKVSDSIINEVIACDVCKRAYKIISSELQFYRRIGLPVPHKCHNCRFLERFKFINIPKLYKRTCMCDKKHPSHEGKCEVEFETSYAPDRPEIVYCERCYQAEVY